MVLHELPKAQAWKTTQSAKRICLAGVMSRANPLAKPKLAAKTAKWPGSPPEQLEMMEAAASFCSNTSNMYVPYPLPTRI